MSSTSIPSHLLHLTTASARLLHSSSSSTTATTTTIRLLSTYPRFRSAHRHLLPSSSKTNQRWTHTQPLEGSKLITPDVPLVIPTHPRSSTMTNDQPEHPCLNHGEHETGKAASVTSTSTGSRSIEGEDRGFGLGLGLGGRKKENKKVGNDSDGPSDRELNEMAMKRLGVKSSNFTASSSSTSTTTTTTTTRSSTTPSSSTPNDSHTLFPSALKPTPTSSPSSTSSSYVEIEQESIGRSARPQAPASSSTSTASSLTKPTGGVAARKAGRTIGLKGKKNAITLTPSAVSRLSELAEPSDPTSQSNSTSPQLLRISVRNRGCAGLAYHLSYLPLDSISKFDEIVEQDGVKVLVDSRALFSVVGSEMDWVEDRMSARFVFKNPNVKDACGCGESFHV